MQDNEETYGEMLAKELKEPKMNLAWTEDDIESIERGYIDRLSDDSGNDDEEAEVKVPTKKPDIFFVKE